MSHVSFGRVRLSVAYSGIFSEEAKAEEAPAAETATETKEETKAEEKVRPLSG